MNRDGAPRACAPSYRTPPPNANSGNNNQKDEPVGDPDDPENSKRRQRLISFGHSQWGFKNWSWSVTKQELDFVDFADGVYCSGVVSYVSIVVNSLNLKRENIGYATVTANQKGLSIRNARKESVTNALCETLLAFGGTIAVQLSERLESFKYEDRSEKKSEKFPDIVDKINTPSAEPKHPSPSGPTAPAASHRKDSGDGPSNENVHAKRSPQRYGGNQHPNKISAEKMTNGHIRSKQQTAPAEAPNFPANHSTIKPTVYNMNQNMMPPPGVAPAPPPIVTGGTRMGGPPAPPPPHPSNVSYLVQHVMPPLYSVQCGPPAPSPPMYRNAFFAEIPSWPVYDNYDGRQQPKVNFGVPPKNFSMNGRAERPGGRSPPDDSNYIPFNMNGAWIKPTIFYDGFWTEQKVQKWVAEQMEKSSPPTDEMSEAQKQMCHSKV